ncbi:MAG: hypothetical protein Q4F28_04380 [Eubacteriales bacterium]|nr:hypothetical protein [Eubacteriales bacterium]
MKKSVLAALAAVFVFVSSFPAFAGYWKLEETSAAYRSLGYDSKMWTYIKDDGSCAEDEWMLIDGKWYYFLGYMITGMRYIDDVQYYFADSGALEVNRDYGFATINEDGVFSMAQANPAADTAYNNIYADYCRSFGVDIDRILEAIRADRSCSISCSTEKVPTDSEGKPFIAGIGECVGEAIRYDNEYYTPEHSLLGLRISYGKADNNMFSVNCSNFGF